MANQTCTCCVTAIHPSYQHWLARGTPVKEAHEASHLLKWPDGREIAYCCAVFSHAYLGGAIHESIGPCEKGFTTHNEVSA